MKAVLTSALVLISLLSFPSASFAGSSTHFGDRIALHFQQGKYHAAKLVADFDGSAVISPIDAKVMNWIVEHKDLLQMELLTSEQDPEDELPETCSALHSCACTGNTSQSKVFIALNNCRSDIKTAEDAGQMLLHEVVHHFNIADESFANDVAIAVYEAWHNLGGAPVPKANWEPMSKIGEPNPKRSGASIVSSGKEVIVWGGTSGRWKPADTSGIYNLKRHEWRPINKEGEPAARMKHTGIWADDLMIIWGGEEIENGGSYSSGERYIPSATGGSWLPMAIKNAPLGRSEHSSVWTGNELIVFGGRSSSHGLLADGGRYDPKTDSWQAIPKTPAGPTSRHYHSAIWTGTNSDSALSNLMIIWGGVTPAAGRNEFDNKGWIYNNRTHLWKKMSSLHAPSARTAHSATWTGKYMLIWGGMSEDKFANLTVLNDGALYDPAKDEWLPIPTEGAPEARANAAAVWTGKTLLIYGGTNFNGPIQKGGMLDCSDGIWTWRKSSGRLNLLAPKNYSDQLSVWTGKNFIKWGGESDDSAGGIYFPDDR